jgi:peptide/nickel transport system substrate-binding protein
VYSNIFDPLLSRDQGLKIVPRLATAYKNVTPTKWRIDLRKGVSFHNGEPFNAESVKFSFERIFAPESKSVQKGQFATIEKIEILDEYTVEIVTKKPDPILPARLTLFYLVPPKYVREAGDVKFNQNPVGTGPFRFVKWIRDDRVELERNEKYWDGAPQIKELVFRSIPETQARLAALQTGEVDIATYLPPDIVEPLQSKKLNFGFKSVLSTRVVYLQLSPLATQKDSPLLKKEVRQAINHAIDRDSLINKILTGGGEKVPTIVPKGIFGYESKINAYPYDPQKAKELLAKVGLSNGFEMELNGPTGRFMRDKEINQAIAGQLEKVGIKTKVKIHEWGTYSKAVTSHTMPSPYLESWSLPSLDPDQWLWPTLHSGEFFSRTNDKEIDKFLDDARSEMDSTKREKLYHEIQKIAYDRSYLCPLYQVKNLFGISNRIDWTPRADEMIYMREAKIVK